MEQDVIVKILELLPAKALAAAACVSHHWNEAATAVAKRPHIASSISLRSNLCDAMREVIAKVLEAPFRPQFAVVFASPYFSLQHVSNLLQRELPVDIPLIGCHAAGIMGVDAATNEFKEVFFYSRKSSGIALITGFLPDVKIESFSIPSLEKATSSTVSSCFNDSSPDGLIVLARRKVQVNEFLGQLSEHFGPQATPLISGGCSAGGLIANCFKRKIAAKKVSKSRRRGSKSPGSSSQHAALEVDHDLVGLSFTANEGNLCLEVAGVGGVSPVGPVYEIVERVHTGISTRLYCKAKGEASSTGAPNFDIVSCRRVSSPLHYLVTWSDSNFVEVEGDNFKSGDDILFFNVDKAAALADRDRKLGLLSTRLEKMQQVMLNLVFACEAREQEFFEDDETDGHHLGIRLPGKPRAGMFCTAEIGPHPDTDNNDLGFHSHTCMFMVFGWNSKQKHVSMVVD